MTVPAPSTTATAGPIPATYTGGAPGPVSYSWSFVGGVAPSGPPVSFLNPLNASSQLVRFGPGLTLNQIFTQTIRCTITDSLGNSAFDDADVQAERTNDA